MKLIKSILLLLAILFVQNVMADNQGRKIQVFADTIVEATTTYILYFQVLTTPNSSATAVIPGTCSLINPEVYEENKDNSNSTNGPEQGSNMRYLRPKGAVKYTGQVKIPGQVGATQAGMQGNYTVSEISGDAFVGSSATSVIIPETVEGIGAGAFSQCGTIESVDVDPNNPNYSSVDGVVYNKEKTGLVQVPGGKTSIIIPASVTSIDPAAFLGCENLASISLGAEGVTENAYFVIVDGILYIKDGENNKVGIAYVSKDVTNLVIPEGVTKISSALLAVCKQLQSITIPKSVTDIDEDAFINCQSLLTITVTAGNSKYSSDENGALYMYNGTSLLCCPAAKTTFVIPEKVTALRDYAFNNCAKLTTLNIPEKLTEVFGLCFKGCTAMTSFTVDPDNTYYSASDGILYNKKKKYMYKCPANKPSFTLDFLPGMPKDAFVDYKNELTISLTDAEKPYVYDGLQPVLPKNGVQIKYLRTLPKNKLGTIILCFIPDNADDFYFYKLNSAASTQLSFVRVEKESIEVGVPYLYKNADDENIVTTMSKSNAVGSDVSTSYYDCPAAGTWTMYGTFSTIIGLENNAYYNYYVLSDGVFKTSSDKMTLSPFRAYLSCTVSSGAKDMEIVLDGEPTGIKLADVDRDVVPNSNVQRYNVSGQKVNDNYKGIVITEGKKYLSR